MFVVLLISLGPPCFVVLHTLIGLALMPIYGVDKWRWRAGAIEVVAGRKAHGTTRIWFAPAAQTWGLVIFCADGFIYENEPLHVHERVHIFQSYLFGVLFPVTYILSFVVLFAIVKLGLARWERIPGDDDVWHAYRKIPWEIWAYAWQSRFEQANIVDRRMTWGSFK